MGTGGQDVGALPEHEEDDGGNDSVLHEVDDYYNDNDLGNSDGDGENDHLEPQQPTKMSLLWNLIVFTLAMINLVFQHLPQHHVTVTVT